MSVCKSCVFSLLSVIFLFNLVVCTEFVPVYLWDTSKTTDHVPALHKVNEDSFKDAILEHLKKDPLVVVFAEQTLSPEDFAQRNEAGESAYPKLSELRKSAKVTYRPYVENPIGAVKGLDKEVTEVTLSDLLKNNEVPKNNIIIVHLNDAKDDEHRFAMLKRHDSDIVTIYKGLVEKFENVLAIYTSQQTSWVAPEDTGSHRSVRSLLAEDASDSTNSTKYFDDNVLLWYNTANAMKADSKTSELVTFTWTSSTNETNKQLVGTAKDMKITFNFQSSVSGYWNMEVENGKLNSEVDVPLAFSYHCGNLGLTSENNTITFTEFQVQPLFSGNTSERFGDAYDCVGFTSAPIWSGLFVTAILLLIMTLGLTMMMDIKTMDRFDDAKGKTISINVSE